jgi:hypothetical protein
MIADHEKRINDISLDLKKLSLDLSRNGLVSVSADTPIGMTQDYGRIAAL